MLTCCVGHDEAPAESLVILNVNVTPGFTDGFPYDRQKPQNVRTVHPALVKADIRISFRPGASHSTNTRVSRTDNSDFQAIQMFRTFTKTKHTNQNYSSCQSQYQDNLKQLNSKSLRTVIAHHPGTVHRFEASSPNDTNGSVERLCNTSSATSRRFVFIPMLYSS